VVFYLNCTEPSRFDIGESVHGGLKLRFFNFVTLQNSTLL